MKTRALMAIPVLLLVLLSTVGAAQPAIVEQNLPNAVASLRLDATLSDGGIPEVIEDGYQSYHLVSWVVEQAPCDIGISEDDADSLTPLVEFGCTGDFQLQLRIGRGITVNQQDFRYPTTHVWRTTVQVVDTGAVDPEAIFATWTTMQVQMAETQMVQAGNFAE